jgi:hypothetical protein
VRRYSANSPDGRLCTQRVRGVSTRMVEARKIGSLWHGSALVAGPLWSGMTTVKSPGIAGYPPPWPMSRWPKSVPLCPGTTLASASLCRAIASPTGT